LALPEWLYPGFTLLEALRTGDLRVSRRERNPSEKVEERDHKGSHQGMPTWPEPLILMKN